MISGQRQTATKRARAVSSWRIIAFQQQILVADARAYQRWAFRVFVLHSFCFPREGGFSKLSLLYLAGFVLDVGCFQQGECLLPRGACESDKAASPPASHPRLSALFSHCRLLSSLSPFLIITTEWRCPGIFRCLLPGKWEVGTPALLPHVRLIRAFLFISRGPLRACHYFSGNCFQLHLPLPAPLIHCNCLSSVGEHKH